MTIASKVANPLNLGNKKVIVFTAFADTAQYPVCPSAQWAHSELGIHSALVTGGGTNKTTMKGLGSDLNNILTAFSPMSKERSKSRPNSYERAGFTDCHRLHQ